MHELMSQTVYPEKNDVAEWLSMGRNLLYYMREDGYGYANIVLAYMKQLHTYFGDAPNEALYKQENDLAEILRAVGVEYRYTDALAVNSGAKRDSVRDPSTNELFRYFGPCITLQQAAVLYYQDIQKPYQVYIDVNDPAFDPVRKAALLKLTQDRMPQGVVVSWLTSAQDGVYATLFARHELVINRCGVSDIVTLLRSSEAPAAIIAKQGRESIEAKIVLKAEAERYILGKVLVPDDVDSQGDVYSEEEVRKAAHWWMENSSMFANRHTFQGGQLVAKEDMVVLENYIMPADCVLEGNPIKKGTWMCAARVASDELWEQVASGALNAFSIGALSEIKTL